MDKELLAADKSGMDYIVVAGPPDNRVVAFRGYSLENARFDAKIFHMGTIYQRTKEGWIKVQ